jgi:hypothetical protein
MLVDGRIRIQIRIRTNNERSGSGRPIKRCGSGTKTLVGLLHYLFRYGLWNVDFISDSEWFVLQYKCLKKQKD